MLDDPGGTSRPSTACASMFARYIAAGCSTHGRLPGPGSTLTLANRFARSARKSLTVGPRSPTLLAASPASSGCQSIELPVDLEAIDPGLVVHAVEGGLQSSSCGLNGFSVDTAARYGIKASQRPASLERGASKRSWSSYCPTTVAALLGCAGERLIES